jgi:hypothetical protein
MTYEMAKKILDRVRDGATYPTHIITAALKVTGDLEESIY